MRRYGKDLGLVNVGCSSPALISDGTIVKSQMFKTDMIWIRCSETF